MSVPFFYIDHAGDDNIILPEDTSRHIVQVLRMKTGEQLNLTDGKGKLFIATLVDDHKKSATVRIIKTVSNSTADRKITIAISLVKNAARFEWFLEKATEIGVTDIIPLICKRTEKQHFKLSRMQNILVSAMLQSKQVWLPVLREPMNFNDLIKTADYSQKYIAHCEDTIRQQLQLKPETKKEAIICIGPEGDFTPDEIELALKNNFTPVILGSTRLRTETAGVVAAVLLNN